MKIGCPIAVEELAQVELLPQHGMDQGDEPGEAVAPLAQEDAEAQEQIDPKARRTRGNTAFTLDLYVVA